jgi:hypothetical protein
MEEFETFVSVLLVVMMFVNVWVTWKLFTFARKSAFMYPALNERTFSAGVKTAASLIIGLVAVNRLFDLNWWGSDVGFVFLLISIILHSLPPILWLYYYKTGKFSSQIEEIEKVSK